MYRIAITGGIACGKSVVAKMLGTRGIPVCDTDRFAHAVMLPGSAAYKEIIDVFGADVVGAKGIIDRGILGRMVFANASLLRRLNSIVHPVVMDQCYAWMQEQALGVDMGAAEIPLLYEAGYDKGWDAVICVWTPRKRQIERLSERGIAAKEAQERLAAQWSTETKACRADYVLINVGSRGLLDAQLEYVIEDIKGKKHGRYAG